MIPAGVRIFLCTEPVDMRYGFDRLAQFARDCIGQDPVAGGALFVFAGRGATRLKVLWFEGHGLCVLYKRLHRATFEVPVGASGELSLRIDGTALAKLLTGVARHTRRGKRAGVFAEKGAETANVASAISVRHLSWA